MKIKDYHNILDILAHGNNRKSYFLFEAKKSFPEVSDDTLHSIYSQNLQRRIKSNFWKHYRCDVMQSYYERCMSHLENNGGNGIIKQIAEEVDFPPVMIARIILEEHLKRTKYQETETVPKGQISVLLKDTKLIQPSELEIEIELCLQEDDDCGPDNDAVKRKIGEKYEKNLGVLLEEKNIPCVCEERLRALGYDKTPDYKLEVPIAVDGCVVNWIESKASFGDEESNTSYLKDQFWSYTNRFGSGMVIYWFGFINELDINRSRGILLTDQLPNDIVTLDMLL